MWPGALMRHIISSINATDFFWPIQSPGKFHQAVNGDASRCSLIPVVKLLHFKHRTTEAVNNEL